VTANADGKPVVPRPSRPTSRESLPLILLVGIYLILGAAYGLVNPLLESPDEALYYENIRFLADERRLPVLQEGELSKGHHPPLYFALGALLTGWVPNEHFEILVTNNNPFWAYRLWEPGVDNKSLYLHDPSLEGWPFQDVALGVRLMRLFSLLLGAGTIVVVYLITGELFPEEPYLAAGAAALVAFNPMFLYIQSSVHNDALVNLLGALTIYGLVRYWLYGPTVGRAAFLGIVCGLGIMTKITFLFLGPAVALVLILRSWLRRRQTPRWWLELVEMGAISTSLVLLFSGWWFVRNQLVYGDPTSMNRQADVWGVREGAPNIPAAARELGFLRDSFWGVFGYGQIPMPRWIYGVLWVLVLLAVAGVFLWTVRAWRRGWQYRTAAGLLALLLVAPLTGLVATFARMTVSATANFGRYLFLSYGVIAPVLALGITEWPPQRARRLATGILTLAMLILGIGALVAVLAPAYAPPSTYASAAEVNIPYRLDAEYPGLARLLGYDITSQTVGPGDEIEVTLFWEVTGDTDENYVQFVQLVADQDVRVGGRDTHGGLGRYPTSRWQPGQVLADPIPVPIDWDAESRLRRPAPTGLRLDMGLHANGQRLQTSDGRDTISAGLIRFAPLEDAPLEGKKVQYHLGDVAELSAIQSEQTQAEPGQSLPFTLTWIARQEMDVDYVVFLHLRDETGTTMAQADGPPQDGWFPTTLWQPGDVVHDQRQLHLPEDLEPGTYQVVAGWYRLDTLTRLPVTEENGQPVPDGTIPLFSVHVPT
jgi:4-amino-4-deoxy-L-arabinose transferase-like glycosyltransferase